MCELEVPMIDDRDNIREGIKNKQEEVALF